MLLFSVLIAVSPLGEIADLYSMKYVEVEQSYSVTHYFCNQDNEAFIDIEDVALSLNKDFFGELPRTGLSLHFDSCNDDGKVIEIQAYFEPEGAEEVIARFTERFGTPRRSSFKEEKSYRWAIDGNTRGAVVTRPYGVAYLEEKMIEEVSAPLEEPDSDDEPVSRYASLTSCIQLDPMLFSLSQSELKRHVVDAGGVYGVLPSDGMMEMFSAGESKSVVEVGSGQEVVRVVLPVENACGPTVLASMQYILVFESENSAPTAVIAMLKGLAPKTGN